MNSNIIAKLAELTEMFQDIASICDAHEVADCDLEQTIIVNPNLTKYAFQMWIGGKNLEILVTSDSDGVDYIAKRENAPAFFIRNYDGALKVIKQYRNEVMREWV